MRQKLLLGIAIGALTMGGAFAQSPTPPSSNQSKPAAAAPANPSTKAPPEKMQTPAAKSGSSAQNKSDKATSGSKTTASAGDKAAPATPKIVASQKPDQLLASKFTGTDVIGSNGKKIGDVSDILFTQDGTIKAYVVSFGGFLGIGAKEVAITPSAFQIDARQEGRPQGS